MYYQLLRKFRTRSRKSEERFSMRLNTWEKNGFKRIYVNDLSDTGKMWLQSKQGQTSVHFEQGVEGFTSEDVLERVSEHLTCDARNFAILWSAVVAAPLRKPGTKVGTTASSRRGIPDQEIPKSGGWTARHTEVLDPNIMTYPLETQVTLYVDDREPAEMVDRLRQVQNLDVQVASLETGDYLVHEKLIIERKTARDLVTSVIEDKKRIFNQVERMSGSGMRFILLIEGDIYRETNMQLPAMNGLLSYLSVIPGVSIIPTLSMTQSVYLMVTMIKHAVQGLGYELGLRGSGPKDPSLAAPFVLEGIPGVSAATARSLHSHFGSIQAVCQASIHDLMEVSGVGKVRAEIIFNTIRVPPNVK
jgi:Fanconi anemia group M protein